MSDKTSPHQPLHKRLFRKFRSNNERGAREAVLEQLFNDFNRSRFSVYKFNFFRGIFFGLGSVLGGTIVIALIIWIMSMLGHVFPALDNLFDGAARTIEIRK